MKAALVRTVVRLLIVPFAAVLAVLLAGAPGAVHIQGGAQPFQVRFVRG